MDTFKPEQKTPTEENVAAVAVAKVDGAEAGSSSSDLITHIGIANTLDILPTFDGNKFGLTRFIREVQNLVINHFKHVQKTECPPHVLNGIRMRIKGKADMALVRAGTKLNWEDIKHTLIINFADLRHTDTLMADLATLAGKGMPLCQLFDEILTIRCALIGILERGDEDADYVTTRRRIVEEMCVDNFVAGLWGVLKWLVKLHQPKTLFEAHRLAKDINTDLHWGKIMKENHYKKKMNRITKSRVVRPSNTNPYMPFNNHNNFQFY